MIIRAAPCKYAALKSSRVTSQSQIESNKGQSQLLMGIDAL